MAIHRWTLIGEGEPRGASLLVRGADVADGAGSWQVEKKTLQAGLSQGVEVVEVETPRLKAVVVPSRGMGLWKVWYGDFALGWRSPVRGPVHPALVPLSEASGFGWLDGFDELMCRCGLESLGAPEHDQQGRLRYPLHGRIANRPAHLVELTVDDVAGTISIHGVVEEARFHFQKLRLHATYVFPFEGSVVAWRDEVENFGGLPAELQMMYHVNFGLPLLGAGAELAAPIHELRPGSAQSTGDAASGWANYAGPTPGFQQQVFYATLAGDDAGQTLVALKNPDRSKAVTVGYNVGELPCFTLWKNCVAEADGYVTGLEPGTSFPNPRTVEGAAGRVVRLAPGSRWEAGVALDLLESRSAIQLAEERIAALQSRGAAAIRLAMD